MKRTAILLATLVAFMSPAGIAAAQDNPFSNDGGLGEPAADPPRARVKPDHIRLQVTEADCRRLVAHQPAADVAYQPGVDVRGDAVAPADLPGSNALGEKLLETEIAFDLELNPLLFAGNAALANSFDEATVNFGRVVYDRDSGRMTLDGEPLTDPQTAAISKACRERLR